MPLDPVCKSYLNDEDIESSTTFKGKTYYFCCPVCRQEFEQNPKKYTGKNWLSRLLHRLEEANAQEFKGKKPSCH